MFRTDSLSFLWHESSYLLQSPHLNNSINNMFAQYLMKMTR